MTDKKLRKKLRKQCKRLFKWALKNGVERVDVYVNALNDFGHEFIPDGPSYFGEIGDERKEVSNG